MFRAWPETRILESSSPSFSSSSLEKAWKIEDEDDDDEEESQSSGFRADTIDRCASMTFYFRSGSNGGIQDDYAFRKTLTRIFHTPARRIRWRYEGVPLLNLPTTMKDPGGRFEK